MAYRRSRRRMSRKAGRRMSKMAGRRMSKMAGRRTSKKAGRVSRKARRSRRVRRGGLWAEQQTRPVKVASL